MDRKLFTALKVLIAAVVVAVFVIMKTNKEDSKVNIGRSDIRIEDGMMTPEVLRKMRAIP